MEMLKLILNYMWKCKFPRIAKEHLKKTSGSNEMDFSIRY